MEKLKPSKWQFINERWQEHIKTGVHVHSALGHRCNNLYATLDQFVQAIRLADCQIIISFSLSIRSRRPSLHLACFIEVINAVADTKKTLQISGYI